VDAGFLGALAGWLVSLVGLAKCWSLGRYASLPCNLVAMAKAIPALVVVPDSLSFSSEKVWPYSYSYPTRSVQQ